MRRFFTQMLVLATMLLIGTTSAFAGDEFPRDGEPIQAGTVYDVKAFVDYKATFTPSVSGAVIQDGCPSLLIEGMDRQFLGYGEYGQVYSYQLEAGTTYVIINHIFIADDGKVQFTLESEQGVQITRIIPEEGSVLPPNVNNSGDVLIHFNTAINFETAAIVVGEVEVMLTNNNEISNTIALRVQAGLNSLYANGTLDEEGGEPVSIVLTGIKSANGVLYGEDGSLKLDYVSSPKLPDLISTNIPEVLKSYYSPDETEGLWTMVFDRDLMDDGGTFLDISCGNPMSDDGYYVEVIPAKVDGATLTFDLRGKQRNLEDYLMYQGNDQVAVKANNIRDTKGFMANGNGQGNVGSYSYSLTYNYLKPSALTSEFDPPTGSSLKDVDEIEIWFNNADLITYDGVEFEYHTADGFKTEVVLKDELDIEEANNEVVIKVKVPEAVKGHEQITVRLYNLVSLDGYQYRIQAQYDMFVVDLLSPIRQGDEIASTGTEDFVFSINSTLDLFYLRYDFYNGEGETGWAYGSILHKQNDGTWTAYNDNFPCYTNYTPRLVVSAYYTENDYMMGFDAAQTYEFTFVGTADPFEYSPVKFVSVDPENWSEIVPEEGFCLTMVYDGLVKIDEVQSGIIAGMGMGMIPFEKLEAVEGEDGYANTWKLYPPFSYLENNASMDISIFAKDQEGLVVEGNMGAYEADCMQLSYIIYTQSNQVEITVDPAPGQVGALNKFVISCGGYDVGLNYSYDPEISGTPNIMNSNWERVYEFTQDDFVKPAEGEGNPLTLVLTCPDITEPDFYDLYIPEGYLTVGEQFEVYFNSAFFGTYQVVTTSITDIEANDGVYSVYNLQGMKVMTTTDRTALNKLKGLYIVNGKKLYLK